MSLINDALKRAKQAQQQAAPPPPESELQFRAADPAAEAPAGPGLSIVAVLVALAVFGGIGFWYFSAPKSPARARSIGTAESAPSLAGPNETRSPSSAPAAEPQPAQSQSQASVAAPTSPGASPPQVAAATPAAEAVEPRVPAGSAGPSAPADSLPSAADTNLAAATPPPPPAPLKLQGIVFNPKRPSAVVSGKSLFRGDRIGTFRVLAIGPDSVTLVGNGETNVLTLPD